MVVMDIKKSIVVFAAVALLCGCTQKNTTDKSAPEKEYNPALANVLEAHGGIDEWNEQQTLSFEMGNQKHTIDLHTRELKISSPGMAMGNDNGTVWMKQDSANFQGSPTFYHSLMFYFHTMPFVLADDGINYEEVPEKEINGTTYKGLKISFNDGVGDASKDNYIMYYHSDTNKMEWMAYTSTYRSQQRSDSFNMIHYKTWENANGFLLPTELQWHQYENGEVGEASGNPRTFTNVTVSTEKMDADFYAMPEGAKVDSASVN